MKYLLLSLPLALMACVKPDCVVYMNGKPVYSECYSDNSFSKDGWRKTASATSGDDSTDNGNDSNGGDSSSDSNGGKSKGGQSDDNGGDSNGGHSDDREHKLN